MRQQQLERSLARSLASFGQLTAFPPTCSVAPSMGAVYKTAVSHEPRIECGKVKREKRERGMKYFLLSPSLSLLGFVSFSLSLSFPAAKEAGIETLSLSLTFFLLVVEGEGKRENDFKTRKK